MDYKKLTPPQKEARIQEALDVYNVGNGLSLNKTAEFHGVPPSTLKHRNKGRLARVPLQKQPNRQLLDDAADRLEFAVAQMPLDGGNGDHDIDQGVMGADGLGHGKLQ